MNFQTQNVIDHNHVEQQLCDWRREELVSVYQLVSALLNYKSFVRIHKFNTIPSRVNFEQTQAN